MPIRMLLVSILMIAQTGAWADTAVKKPRKKAPSANTAPTPVAPAPFAPGIIAVDAFSNPDTNGHQKIIDALAPLKSGDTVEMWMFSMSDPNVVNALLDAGQRGTKITIIFNAGMYQGDELKVEQTLEAGTNIKVWRASPKFSITHAKTFIVKSQAQATYAWIMSLNTTNNQAVQADFAVKTIDHDVLADLQKLFDVDVLNAQNKTGNEIGFTSPNIIVSPVNSLDRLLELINSAKTSIDLTVENLAYSLPTPKNKTSFTQIVDALTAKIKAGLKVRVLTPGCDMNPSNPGFNLTAINQLNSAQTGVGRVMLPYPASAEHPYMHQKIIIIDGTRFYVGSENFSANSLQHAREIGVVTQVTATTSIINDVFQTEWDNAPVTPPASIPRNCQAIPNISTATASELMSKEPEEDAKQAEREALTSSTQQQDEAKPSEELRTKETREHKTEKDAN